MLYATTATAPVFGLRREIDQLFEDTFRRGAPGRSEWAPAVDVRETNQELTFAVELPGVMPDDVTVTALDGVLTIEGERTQEQKEGDEGRYHLVERNYGSFMRRFQLPPGVDSDRIEADVEQGILRVRVPKAALPQAKKIQVSAGVSARGRTQQAIGGDASYQASAKKAVANEATQTK
jgi:HSP20 family protein